MAKKSKARLIFTIGNVSCETGFSVVVPVKVVTYKNAQFGVGGGFNLAVDILPSGPGLPKGITLNPIVSGEDHFSNPVLNTAFNNMFKINGIVNSNISSNKPLVNNVPSTVFNLMFNVSTDTVRGVYPINFSSNILTSVTDSNGNALVLYSQYKLINGSITVI